MLVCVGHGLNPNYWFSHAQAHILVISLNVESSINHIFKAITFLKVIETKPVSCTVQAVQTHFQGDMSYFK